MMEGINKIAESQQELGEKIQKFFTNMKKDATSRKTASYISGHAAALEKHWQDVQKNNEEAGEYKKAFPGHSYFKSDFISQIQKVYEDAKKHLTDHQQKLEERIQQEGSEGAQNKLEFRKMEVDMRRLVTKIEQAKVKLFQDQTKATYQYVKDSIITKWQEIEKINSEILKMKEEDQSIYHSYDEFDDLDEQVIQVVSELSGKITGDIQPTKQTLTLPKVKLDTFEGSYEKWTTFHDMFQQMVHKNTSLSKVEKMQYLKTLVTGEPSKLIQHLQIAEVNYETALKLLQDRYENKRLLLSKLLDKILDIPKISVESAEKIKQLHDTTIECLEAIKNMGVPTSEWGPIISHIIIRKWDGETNRQYEMSVRKPKEIQDFESLMEFLRNRFQSLEAISEANKDKKESFQQGFQKKHWQQKTESGSTCSYCKHPHVITSCQKFKELNIAARNKVITDRKLCINCLMHDKTRQCNSNSRCLKCNRFHHTLLHKESRYGAQEASSSTKAYVRENKPKNEEQREPKPVVSHVGRQSCDVLLATALVKIRTNMGDQEMLRMLVDPGSQASFITEKAAQVLGLPRQKIKAEVSGLGSDNPKVATGKIKVEIQPRFPSNFTLNAELLILSSLTHTLPKNQLENIDIQQWQNYLLADPTYNIPGPIDVILGAEEYGNIILEGLWKTGTGLLGQNTNLGWLISGGVNQGRKANPKIVSMMTRAEADEGLTKFWEIEEIPRNKVLSSEEKECEEHFQKNHHRNANGNYVVKIPFKKEPIDIGESRGRAVARLLQLEKRLSKDEELGNQYRKFMREYLELGHMVRVMPSPNEDKYYIPHQAVIKESSSTTKLRVVFDASSKTSKAVSLNEIMHTGPRLQQELFDIVLRWRKHRVVFSADIEKMYRQISIAEEDQRFQKIVWRFDTRKPIEEFNLTTVTYGTASAPYLAIKTLQQLAKDEEAKFPEAAEVILKDFYVDDVLSGTNSIQQARQLQDKLIKLLAAGGFKLRKWSSNQPELLEDLPEELKDQSWMELSEDGTKRSLGVHWNPSEDTFKFKVDVPSSKLPSKRVILSEISKLFDPLGWLAPVIIKAKLMIQELWEKQLDWDQPIPEESRIKWNTYRDQLYTLEEISLPRWMTHTGSSKLELHGFCDASEKAFGAVVYSRTTNEVGETNITMLVAKSKVAPIKMRKTLPRLELCAAVLLAKLLKRTTTALDCENIPLYAWTDSMITLSWIKGEPGRWKTFVANRVAEICELLSHDCWNHVRTKDNPADVISRGIDPANLKEHSLWWKGPDWLPHKDQWPKVPENLEDTEEETKLCHQISVKTDQEVEIIKQFSSLTRMIRVISYCNRFITNCRTSKKTTGSLSVQEMDYTLKQIIRRIQQAEMKDEVKNINGRLVKQTKLSSLSPFIDQDGIIRVGGRLANSMLNYNEKHPIIIPFDSHITELIIQDAHSTTLHSGNQATLAYTRRKFWIINGKRAVNRILNKCIKCIKHKARTTEQLMGDLPNPRVTPSPPFTHTGVDYAGPIQIRTTKGRGNKSYKGYISVFVCLATKAIHLEVVSDMSTEAFLAAFRRFVARRGHCAHMYSDNGTTFVGASKVLAKEVLALLKNDKIEEGLSTIGTQWHFIPPAAPHFGGLWEAGVKSMKYHLKRIIGDSTLTYEELTTLLHQIEACLNSRPLCPLSNDVNDIIALTPGHFLVGQALVIPPDSTTGGAGTCLTNRWRMVQKMKRDFWKSWTAEYLNKLQQRYKWKSRQENIKIGDLVLLKEENINPNKWPLARVSEVYPAKDGAVRVVTIKQPGGTTLKRPVTKLVMLPVDRPESAPADDEEEDTSATTISTNVSTFQETSVRRRPSRRKNTALRSMGPFFLSLFLAYCMANTSQATHIIKHPDPGLYVEHIGSAKIERGTFRIEVKYQKARIKENEANINKTVAQVEDLCKRAKELTDETQCTSLVHHLSEQQKQLQWTIRSMNGVIKSRQKRGVLGNLLTALFGVNDEVYKDINTLDTQQQELIKASSHQTKFMLSALSEFNDTEVRIENKLNNFNKKLNQGIEAINQMHSWYRVADTNKLNIQVMSAYQLATNYNEELQQLYSKLLDVHFNRGHLYEFISPARVEEIISTASGKLPSTISILSSPVIQMMVEHSQDYIHIFGYFVIAELTEFTTIKVTPVPLKIENGTYWTLDVPSELLAVDYNSQTYFELTKEEFRSSIKLSTNKYLCSPAVVRNIQTSPNCIIDEIYQQTEMPRCAIRKNKIGSIIWKQLYMTNTWMFITNKPTKIAITCKGIREDVAINATGIIQISQDCIIQTKQNILTPKMFDTVPVLAGLVKTVQVQIPSNIKWDTNAQHEIETEPVFRSSDQLGGLRDEEQVFQEDFQGNIWKTVSHSTITSSLTTVVILCVVIFGWSMYKKKEKQPEQSTATTTEFEMVPLYAQPSATTQAERHTQSERCQNV